MNKRVLGLCVALFMAFALVACDDDSNPSSSVNITPASSDSESSEPNSSSAGNVVQPLGVPDTVQTLDELMNEYKCRESYKCAHTYLVEWDNIMECTGSAWAYLSEYTASVCGYEINESAESSSSEVVEVESSSSEQEVSSSSEDVNVEPATDCYAGGANITISSIENLNMTCGSSTEGWEIYDSDRWILYTCTNGTWVEEEAIPCVLE